MTDSTEDLDAALAELRKEYARAAGPRVEQFPPLLDEASQRAAVRGWFNPAKLWSSLHEARATDSREVDSTWLQGLRKLSLVDQVDPGRWFLLDTPRRNALDSLARQGLLDDAVATSGDDPHAALMRAMVANAFDPARHGTGELAAAADVARWLEPVSGVQQPSPAQLASALELRLRDDELDRLSRDMVGREDEIIELRRYLHDVWAKPPAQLPIFRLSGIGGIGKSTLLAEFVRRRLPVERFGDAIVIWIDYDRLRISSRDVASVLIEIARQLAWALPARAEALALARSQLRDGTLQVSPETAFSARQISEISEEDAPSGHDDTKMRAMTDILAQAILGAGKQARERNILVVLDTLEQLDRIENRGYDLILALSQLRHQAARSLAVIASGRSVFTGGVGSDAIILRGQELAGLSRRIARDLLVRREKMDPDIADSLLAAFSDLSDQAFRERLGVPMLLTLLARLIRDGRLDLSTHDLSSVRDAATAEMAAAYVYYRVLEHVPPELSRLAHPGLVLREVSANLLREVVWPVVEPDIPLDEANAERLYQKLANETWLVEPVMGAYPPRVAHRADLRRAMLLLMYAEQDGKIRRELVALNRKACVWHRNRSKAAATPAEAKRHLSECVYHSLALAVFTGHSGGIKIGEVRAVRDQLKGLILDFPEEHRSGVSALILGDAEPAVISTLPIHLRAPVVKERMRGFLARRAYRDGTSFAAALPEEERGRSPTVAWLVIRCFLQSGAWASQAKVARSLVRTASSPGLQFGKARPSILPYLAAFVIGDRDGHAAARLSRRSPPAGISPAVRARYEAIELLFDALAASPQQHSVEPLMGAIERVLKPLSGAQSTGDRTRFAAVLGSLLLRSGDAISYQRPLAGMFSVALQSLAGEQQGTASSLSAARLVQKCRSADASAGVPGIDPNRPYRHLAAVFSDFHSPLGLALATAMTERTQAYRIADMMWSSWPIRPPDFRPSAFAEACLDPAARRERFRTMAAFADRAMRTEALLDAAQEVFPLDRDLAAVILAVRRWRAVLAPAPLRGI